MDDKILDKIRKCLRLAESPNEHEAFAAAMKAQEIAAKYGVDITTLETEGVTVEVSDMVIDTDTKGLAAYAKMIALVLAPNFRVICYQQVRNGGVNLKVIGLTTDAQTFSMVFQFTCNAYQTLAAEFLKGYPYATRSGKLALKNDYLLGFTRGLRDKLAENANIKALILVTPNSVVEYYKNKNLVKGKPSSMKTAKSSIAQEAGYRDGKTLTQHSKLTQ